MKKLIIVALWLAGCSMQALASQPSPAENPLLGSWKSDKFLTRQSIINEHRLSADQKSLLMKSGGYGEIVLTVSEDVISKTGEDESVYSVQEVRGNTVILAVSDAMTGEARRLYIRMDGEQIYVPSSEATFYEVYTRQ